MNHTAIRMDCKFYVRENRSMKNATKKTSAKKATKKAPAKKKK